MESRIAQSCFIIIHLFTLISSSCSRKPVGKTWRLTIPVVSSMMRICIDETHEFRTAAAIPFLAPITICVVVSAFVWVLIPLAIVVISAVLELVIRPTLVGKVAMDSCSLVVAWIVRHSVAEMRLMFVRNVLPMPVWIGTWIAELGISVVLCELGIVHRYRGMRTAVVAYAAGWRLTTILDGLKSAQIQRECSGADRTAVQRIAAEVQRCLDRLNSMSVWWYRRGAVTVVGRESTVWNSVASKSVGQ